MKEIKCKFLIVCQNWTASSNGVSILYKLSSHIEQLGYECNLYIYDHPTLNPKAPPEYQNRVVNKIDENDDRLIVILPDALPFEISKSIKAKNRVWYLLNKPMVLTKEPIFIQENDLFVSYSGLVNKNLRQLFYNAKIEGIDNIIEKITGGEITKKNQILVYWGKARKTHRAKLFFMALFLKAKIVPITRTLPSCKTSLLKLLAESKLLVTFDPLTNLSYEATLCKTPVFIADNYSKINYRDYNIPLYGLFEDIRKLQIYYKRGIKDSIYRKILTIYDATTQNHLQTTELFVKYVTGTLDSKNGEKTCKDNNPALRDFFLSEYRDFESRRKLFNPALSEYVPVLNMKAYLYFAHLKILLYALNVILFLFTTVIPMNKGVRGDVNDVIKRRQKKSLEDAFRYNYDE